MSAYFNAATKYLTATLGGTVPVPNDWKLLTIWARVDTTITGSTSRSIYIDNADGANLSMRFNATPQALANGQMSGGGGVGSITLSTSPGTLTWRLTAVYCGPDDGANHDIKGNMDGGTYGFQSRTTTNTDTASWTNFSIGADPGGTNNFEGWLADAAIWLPASATEAETIISQLWNSGTPKTADNIAAKTPIWYDKLYDGINNNIGTALTNHGTTGFSTSIHPSLTGPSSGPTSFIGAGGKFIGAGGKLLAA